MTNKLSMIVIMAAVLVNIPAVTEAALTMRLERTAGQFSGNGGEFDAYYDGLYKEQTFCLEKGQSINLGTTYDVHSILGDSITGPNGNQIIPDLYGGLPYDPISGETAWLFLEFHKEVNQGGSGALNYLTGTRSDNAGKLQNAIWQNEGENLGVNGGNNSYYAQAQAASAGDKAYALSVVRAANPITLGSDGTSESDHKQSMLTVVPEPATVLVWSALSVMGFARFRRRRTCD